VRHLQEASAQSQLTPLPPPAPPVMPPLPKAFPNGAPDPAFQSKDVPTVLGQALVGPPALHVSAPAVSKLTAAQTLAAPP
jgi:hypothetical protein